MREKRSKEDSKRTDNSKCSQTLVNSSIVFIRRDKAPNL